MIMILIVMLCINNSSLHTQVPPQEGYENWINDQNSSASYVVCVGTDQIA